MSQLSPERWEAVSSYLDRALEMPPTERAAWLETLKRSEPSLAEDLASLLEERNAASRAGFLNGVPLRPPLSFGPGDFFGAYRLVSLLGLGGMGQVWLAERSDGAFTAQAAVKILNAGVGEERLRQEAGILARLTHPHVAHLIDAGLSRAGQPFLVLEYVDGERIDSYCDARRLPIEERLRLYLEVVAAVAHAHANLIVHRDIKPSNILVGRDGRVKLLDFGIAKLLEADAFGGPSLTLESGRALTPEYAAPEQITGGAITTATDVYSLGVVLYALLCGRHPVVAERRSPAELVRAIMDADAPRLSTAALRTSPDAVRRIAEQRSTTPERLPRTLRGDLETIVTKAMKKDPAERYASVAALADDVQRYLQNLPIGAQPDCVAYRTRKFVRRNRMAVSLGAVVVLALIAGLAGTIWQGRRAEQERDVALAQLQRAESINEFTAFLLGQAVPGGKPVTIRAVLERAEQLVERRFSEDETAAADLLVTIGGIYSIRDETENARRTLQRAYERSRRLSDPTVKARAACVWARSVMDSGDFPGARRLIEEALASTTDEARFDSVVGGCYTSLGTVAMEAGHAALAAAATDTALARLNQRPDAYPEVRFDILQLSAVSRRMLGDTQAANRGFAEALELLKRIGRDDTTNDAGVLLHNWAINVANTDTLEALAMNRRVAEIFSGESPEAVPLPSLLNTGMQLNRLARYAEARTHQETARAVARMQGNIQIAGRIGLQIATACRHLGDLPCAREALAEAEPELRSTLPQGHRALADLLREQGLLAAAEGDAVTAGGRLGDAIAVHEKVSEKHVTHIETLLAAGHWELARGQMAEAEARGRRALALAEQLRDGTRRSAWVGLSQWLLGRIRQAQHDDTAAARLQGEALAHMEPTLGEDHPAVREARDAARGEAVP